jgi:hypothetical protein
MASDEDKVVADISNEVLEFVKPKYIRKKNAPTKGAVKNRLLRLYYVSRGFLDALLWWTRL